MKQRIITAAIMLAVCIPLLVLGGIPFIFLVSILSLIGLYEFLRLKKFPLLMRIISYVFMILIILLNTNDFSIDYRIIFSIMGLFLIAIIFYKKDKYNINDALFLIGSVLFLGITFKSFIVVRNMGLDYILFLLLITIITDTFAYITGLLIGKHKMCPNVSPNKTWEGFVGGLLIGTFVSTAFYYTALNTNSNLLVLTLIIAALSVIGQIGDLVFSAIKRNFDIKDYSNIFPGHGGVLDRVDSLLFVLLAFSLISAFLL